MLLNSMREIFQYFEKVKDLLILESYTFISREVHKEMAKETQRLSSRGHGGLAFVLFRVNV